MLLVWMHQNSDGLEALYSNGAIYIVFLPTTSVLDLETLFGSPLMPSRALGLDRCRRENHSWVLALTSFGEASRGLDVAGTSVYLSASESTLKASGL